MPKGDTTAVSFMLALLMAAAAHAQVPTTQLWRDRSPHESRHIELRGLRFHYLDWGGKGDALVFLSGQGCTPHLFDELAPRFVDTHRVLGFTRRGTPQSDRPESGYDTKTLAEDVLAFMDAMKLPRVTLVGLSLGGSELTWIANHHPQRIARLIYLDAAYEWSAAPSDDGLPDVKTLLLEVAATRGKVEGWRALLKKYLSEGNWSEAVEAEMRAQLEIRPDGSVQVPDVMGWLRVWQALSKGAVEAKLDYAGITTPALAIYAIPADPEGKRAAFIRWQRDQIETFRKAGRHIRIVELKDTPHACFVRPADLEVVVREMRSFLKSAEAR